MKTYSKDRTLTFRAELAGFFNRYIFKRFGFVICNQISRIGRDRKDYIYSHEYLRFSSLELVAHEIYSNNIKGSVAELGVFQGDFAKLINESFPDRKLYLFDTFEGFDKRDIETEHKKNNSADASTSQANSNLYHDFSRTNIELVLSKMMYKENCIIKKGYFPESAKDVEDEFAFVSIDADLYEPIYRGLCYFYPRLKRGGYIFVHDFNDGIIYTRVKEAVKKFCNENNVNYFPLSDNGGSAVIAK